MDAPTPPPAAPPADPADLTTDQHNALVWAKQRARPIRRAIATAKTDASIAAFFAVACLASGLFDVTNVLWGGLLGWAAFNSFRGARRLARFDATGAKLLAKNQMLLAAIIIVYAAFALHAGLSQTTTSAADLEAYKSMGIDVALIYKAFYISVMIGTVIVQGVMCLYYLSRGRLIRTYIAETPVWVVEMHRAEV